MATVWEQFKDLFKSDEQKKQEKQQKLADALKNEKEIEKQLEELDKQYQSSLPEEEQPDLDALFPKSPQLDELTYDVETDEELEQRLGQENDIKKQLAQRELYTEFERDKEKKVAQKQKSEQSLKDAYAQLEQLYDELRLQAQNKASKQGLSNSSIADEMLDDADRAVGESKSAAEKDYRDQIAAIDSQIERLGQDLDAALDKLDIKYAEELEEKINKLKQQRDDKIVKYQKYNNSVRQKNAAAEEKRRQNIADYLDDLEQKREKERIAQEEYEKEHGYSGEKLENYSRRYELALDFYTSLSPDIALEALDASPNMKYYLGNYYTKLRNAVKNFSGQNQIY